MFFNSISNITFSVDLLNFSDAKVVRDTTRLLVTFFAYVLSVTGFLSCTAVEEDEIDISAFCSKFAVSFTTGLVTREVVGDSI